MVLEKLGSSLSGAMRRLLQLPVVDEAAVKEYIREIQRALLQSDVNVKVVLSLTEAIEKRARAELPPGISRKEHIIRVTYDEMVRILGGDKVSKPSIKPGRTAVFMLVGIQGSGKTTTVAKLARLFSKKGLKPAIVCADTYRPGALDQISQLAYAVGVPVYSEDHGSDAVQIAVKGVDKFRKEKHDVVIVDTAGRHKDEVSLINEMRALADRVNPDSIFLVIDGTIGQQAHVQAKAFHEATSIGSIIVSKLDGSARGGGALSASAATGAPISYVGVGERIDDLEGFDPTRFVGRLLGMGDLSGLIERVKEAELKVPEKKAKAILRGKFTLTDMYSQLESVQKVGSLDKILSMIPGLGYTLPKEALDDAQSRLAQWRSIIQSMTDEEKENPKILNSRRIKRIARGSGTPDKAVKELVSQYSMMKKVMKTMSRRRLPFTGRLPAKPR